MKVIFSRKGFDGAAGGWPSLIFPDGTLFSIPIPIPTPGPNEEYLDKESFYSELEFPHEGDSIQSILNEVTGGRIYYKDKYIGCDYSAKQQHCHHDPMLIRPENRLVLGQSGSAESHLQNQKVGNGDIFLFYGWFRHVEKKDGRWQYMADPKDIHLIWSWMKIGEICDVAKPNQQQQASAKYPFLSVHPHIKVDWQEKFNRIYISDKGGLLPYSDSRCLTDRKEYKGRSKWRLPICFKQKKDAFTFLGENNFNPEGDDVIIKFRGYGQEFVLNLEKVSSGDKTKILAHLDQMIPELRTSIES